MLASVKKDYQDELEGKYKPEMKRYKNLVSCLPDNMCTAMHRRALMATFEA